MTGDDGALCPVAGWHLSPAKVEIEDVIDRIVRDHVTTPPEAPQVRDMCADMTAVYHRIGSASLFDGAWRLRPATELQGFWRDDGYPILPVIDLADGSAVCALENYHTRTFHWIICRTELGLDGNRRLAENPQDIPVYGTSLAHLLDAALDSGGDIAHLETGKLTECGP